MALAEFSPITQRNASSRLDWPDHASQPRRDDHFGRVNKAFEPLKAKLDELHLAT
jgi:hypothetical protein